MCNHLHVLALVPLVLGPRLAHAQAPDASSSSAVEDGGGGPPGPAGLVPPQVLSNAPAVYPTGHQEAVRVVVRVVISPTGQVSGAEVLNSGGSDFDAAAIAAVFKWHFSPALRDGVPFAARVEIPFDFAPLPVITDGGEATDAGQAAAVVTVDAGPTLVVDAGPPPSVTEIDAGFIEVEEDAGAGSEEEVSVRGALKKVDRGGSDFQISVAQQAMNVQSAKELLDMAPGIFQTNEGGMGHAEQVFLRGFDAQTGAGIEFTFGGVPINEVDNTDGHGYADTHFIIPEVVKELRVVEGPFDPHQGDFAEAGSVDYVLGVPDRRLQISTSYGSFDTERVLGLWAPEGEREGTFGAVQAETTKGYGTNRAGTDASGMAQYEGELGSRGLWRALVTAYATQYQSAGVVRADDISNPAIGFYGTEDSSQGGAAQRYTGSFSLENPMANGGLVTQQLFLTWRTLILDEDFTGFLLDDISPGDSLHGQRGDGILQNYTALTAGGRGGYKLTRHLFGEDQSIELGYFARYDHTTPSIDRVRYGTQIPYAIDEDLTTDVLNIAGFVDLDAHFGHGFTLRGGVRQEYFDYDINNLCAGSGNYITGASVSQGELLNVPCPNFDSSGRPRINTQNTTAGGLITEPKVTGLYQLTPSWTATASVGIGATSQDATLISQDEQTPFTQITAGEAGVKYHHRFERGDLSGRLIGYYTHTTADQYFNPDLGRLSPAGPTTRGGGVFEARLAGPWYDELANATYAYAIYDQDGTLVPYIPNLIARSDTAIFHNLPWRLGDHPFQARAGLGLSYIGQRALPLGQFAAPTFVMNASAKVRWSFLEVGLEGENLLNTQYASAEFFYASYFPHSASITYPTLAPVEEFTAAPPLTLMATLSIILDKENDR